MNHPEAPEREGTLHMRLRRGSDGSDKHVMNDDALTVVLEVFAEPFSPASDVAMEMKTRLCREFPSSFFIELQCPACDRRRLVDSDGSTESVKRRLGSSGS